MQTTTAHTTRTFFLAALLWVAVPAAADHETAPHPALSASTAVACSDSDPNAVNFVTPVDVPVGAPIEFAFGAYTAPPVDPTVLVVIGHGSTHTVESWKHHMTLLTDTYGVLAVSMEYVRRDLAGNLTGGGRPPMERVSDHVNDEGTLPPGTELPRAKHWPQRSGGEDLIAATKRFQAQCPTITKTILVGVSMGVSMSGYAVSHLDPADVGLFDYWVACEGVHDMTETYSEATATLNVAQAWIEAETGGTPATVPNEYEERTNVLKTDAIELAGLDRVVYLHAAYDGLVGYHQSRQMAQQLDIPFEFYTVTSRGEGPEGTVLTDHLIDGEFGLLAGHAGEWDFRALLMRATLERIGALALDPLPDCGEYHIEEGETYPDVVFPAVATHDCSLGGPELNDAPNAVDDDAVTPVDVPVNIPVLANDSDPEGDPITTIAATPGGNGSTEVQPDGSVTYTPDEGFLGSDTFDYIISDGLSGSDTGTVNLPEPGRALGLAAGALALVLLGVARRRRN